jgi:heparan-alpha-glucosaminide N-acetyltransferase
MPAPEATLDLAPAPAPAPRRLLSLDAYRGLVMFLLLTEHLGIGAVAKSGQAGPVWAFLHEQQSHVDWVGCVLHDLIQPSFSFLVGAALAFSVANRRALGQGIGRMLGHAAIRAFVLIALGILLRSIGQRLTNYTFEDTLTQIGLGYFFLFLLALRPARDQWIALAVIGLGYWLFFALWPLPGADFDWARAGVSPQSTGQLTGFAAHWSKNTNAAWAFDTWFMNLFPREQPFTANRGGYSTLSFIPTLGTMLLGLLAGGWLRFGRTTRQKLALLTIAGLVLLAAGWALGAAGLCPVVKRIWTPSWMLFSGGLCLLFTAFFSATTDVPGWRKWSFPLMVLGANSMAAYLMEWLWPKFLREAIQRHVPDAILNLFGAPYAPFVTGCCVVLTMWLILFTMWRKKIFLKI